MGRDGKTTSTTVMASFVRDVMGYSLGYFNDDYTSIGNDEFELDYNPSGGSSFGNANYQHGLLIVNGWYNGNIRHTVLSLDSVNYPTKLPKEKKLRALAIFNN